MPTPALVAGQPVRLKSDRDDDPTMTLVRIEDGEAVCAWREVKGDGPTPSAVYITQRFPPDALYRVETWTQQLGNSVYEYESRYPPTRGWRLVRATVAPGDVPKPPPVKDYIPTTPEAGSPPERWTNKFGDDLPPGGH